MAVTKGCDLDKYYTPLSQSRFWEVCTWAVWPDFVIPLSVWFCSETENRSQHAMWLLDNFYSSKKEGNEQAGNIVLPLKKEKKMCCGCCSHLSPQQTACYVGRKEVGTEEITEVYSSSTDWLCAEFSCFSSRNCYTFDWLVDGMGARAWAPAHTGTSEDNW